MSETPKVEISRRGLLTGAGLTAATTVLDSAAALARDAKEAAQAIKASVPTLYLSSCMSTDKSTQ
jgi:xanthine dehydrogenase YagT iron-sulfur-binding subunit